MDTGIISNPVLLEDDPKPIETKREEIWVDKSKLPSILPADFSRLGEELKMLEEAEDRSTGSNGWKLCSEPHYRSRRCFLLQIH